MPVKTKAAATKASATRKTSATAASKPTAKSTKASAKSSKAAAKPVKAAAAKPAKAAAAKPAKAAAAKPAKAAAAAKPAKSTAAKPSKAAAAKSAKPAKATGKPAAASKKRKAADDASTEPEPEAKKAKKETPAAASPKSNKRKTTHDDSTEPEAEADMPKAKKPKKDTPAAASPKAKKPVHVAIGKKVNDVPTQILDVYVFGEGTSGELGLGSVRVNGKKPTDVRRPRLNGNLSAKTVGVLDITCGGMHAVALTRDHKILTWGVNDQGALGRDTTWEGGLRDVDDDEGSDSGASSDTGMNPLESTPTALSDEYFAPGTKFVQVVAGDSATFLLTEDGRVYGWGTFRSSDGVLGFTDKIHVQETPMLLPTLKNIKALAAGTNHVLALDHKGFVFAWGCGQQNQLGRRIIERNKLSSLIPQRVGLPRGKIVKVACGAYHCFALDKDGNVWGWGLNNMGEIGADGNAGEDDAVILKPAKVDFLDDHEVTGIDGGMHHSLACTAKGELLTWGRVDGYQIGYERDQLNKDDVLFDEHGNPRILVRPSPLAGISNVAFVSAGTDNSFAVTSDGRVYSWGFSANYQTGQGVIEDVHTPSLVDNSAIRDKKITAAYAGGQFSIVVGPAEEEPQTNGVSGK